MLTTSELAGYPMRNSTCTSISSKDGNGNGNGSGSDDNQHVALLAPALADSNAMITPKTTISMSFSPNTAAAAAVRDFVSFSRGHTVITKVLIANNGMAAVKAIRSIRRWAYEQFGDDRAISFTVMATPEDLTINAEYIRMADQFVEVPGGSSNHNYANVDLIVDIAVRTGVHVRMMDHNFYYKHSHFTCMNHCILLHSIYII